MLSKTDTYVRHKSFEFRAVYYTLANLEPQHANIRTVYSNFSPMGLFYVDKYPADLVIVYNDGSVDLYQFDGHYVHGCGQGCAQKKQRYVDGQTHDQVRAKTEKRDTAFEQWIGGSSGGGANAAPALCNFYGDDAEWANDDDHDGNDDEADYDDDKKFVWNFVLSKGIK